MLTVRLGAFELDPLTGELTRAGRRIHLPAQSATLLALLVRRAPEIVTREEIRCVLWGADTHVEFDAAVNACISQIRTALGDSARAPRFIETVPRHGYRCLVGSGSRDPGAGSRDPGAGSREPGSGSREPGSGSRDPGVGTRITGDTTAGSRIPDPGSRRLRVSVTAALVVAVGALVWLSAAPTRAIGSHSLVAMQKFERGASGLADASPPELVDRVKHFETAIAADPDFAAAYAGLADAKLLIGTYRVEPPQIAYAAAKAAARTALAIDPDLAEAHAVFGAAVLYFEWDWAVARAHLHRAVALDPRSPRVQLWMTRYHIASGRPDLAVTSARRAVALAPGSPSALTALGLAHYYARRYEAAAAACGDAVTVMREFVPALVCMEAAAAGAARSPNALLNPAVDLVRAGERDRALDWLQRAANRRSDSLIFAGVEPGLDPLRGDPRFAGVLQRVGGRRE